MTDNNLSPPGEPVVTTPPTQDQLVEDISELLDAPETDPVVEPEKEAAEAGPEDDPLGLDVEAEDVGEADADEPDGSDEPEIKGGRFAPDSAKVTLDDGSVITVAELKRNNLYQRGFTEKTTALAEERKVFEAERQTVTERAQSLDQFQEYAAWYAEQFLPQQPPAVFQGNPSQDPIGYQNWQHQRDIWNAHVQAYEAFQGQKQAETQRVAGETQKHAEARITRERNALLKAMPVLKDPVKGKQVWDAMVAGAQEHFGITEEEVNTVADHRMLVALREAIAYRRIKAKAPQVQAEVTQKPAVRQARRVAPTTAVSKEKQVLSERLRSSGRLDDFVAAASHLFE